MANGMYGGRGDSRRDRSSSSSASLGNFTEAKAWNLPHTDICHAPIRLAISTLKWERNKGEGRLLWKVFIVISERDFISSTSFSRTT